eukprot:910538-Amorphochlora_amoeboformis.AAC.1
MSSCDQINPYRTIASWGKTRERPEPKRRKARKRVTKLDIKTAHAQIMKCPDFKSELITRIRKQM